MKKFKTILEEIANVISSGNLATYDAPISKKMQRRAAPDKNVAAAVFDVANMESILQNINGKKKHARWNKILKDEGSSQDIKKTFNNSKKKDIVLNHSKSNTSIYLRKKGN
jgi:hypothetical protein